MKTFEGKWTHIEGNESKWKENARERKETGKQMKGHEIKWTIYKGKIKWTWKETCWAMKWNMKTNESKWKEMKAIVLMSRLYGYYKSIWKYNSQS